MTAKTLSSSFIYTQRHGVFISYWYKVRRFNFKYNVNEFCMADTAFIWQLPKERHAAVLHFGKLSVNQAVTTTKRANSVPVP